VEDNLAANSSKNGKKMGSGKAVSYVNFVDPSIWLDMDAVAPTRGVEQRQLIQDFMLHLALCHTVIPERADSSGGGASSKAGGPNGVSKGGRSSKSKSEKRSWGGGGSREGPSAPLLSSKGKRPPAKADFDSAESMKKFVSEDGSEDNTYYEDESDEDEDEDEDEVILSASSPDEQALVSGAKFFGYEFYGRRPGQALVKTKGQSAERAAGAGRTQPVDAPADSVYDVMEVLEFTSARKRMTTVVRMPPDEIDGGTQRRSRGGSTGSSMESQLEAKLEAKVEAKLESRSKGELRVLCKGADTVMFPLLRQQRTAAEDRVIRASNEHLQQYAEEGLRTLVVAQRTIEEDVFERWHARFKKAVTDLDEIERQKQGEPNLIDELAAELETDLSLLGVTGIEDKLQEGVPKCIADLAAAQVSTPHAHAQP
jgi:magnesium-transporting ATPase (P-type)